MDKITVNGTEYLILRLIGHGKGGYSYLAKRDGHEVVVKQIHHEPCDYYNFGNKIEAEQHDYGRLQSAGIRIPKMLDIDTGAERIVKEYVDGPTAAELIKSGASVIELIPQVRDMAEQAKAAGLNIDYYLANFVVCDGLGWYVDYECNPYSEQWDLDHWGLKYWTGEAEIG